MNYAIVNAVSGHVSMMCEALRPNDKEELKDFGVTAKRALWRSWRASMIRKAAFVDGEIAALWGIVGSPLGIEGNIWLLTGTSIERAKYTFIKEARREVHEALEIFPMLTGVVSIRYTQAVRFLELLGFTVFPAENGPYSTFRMTR